MRLRSPDSERVRQQLPHRELLKPMGGKPTGIDRCGPQSYRGRPASGIIVDKAGKGLVAAFGLAQLFQLRGALLHAPLINRFDIEAPIAADLETWELPSFEQPVDR